MRCRDVMSENVRDLTPNTPILECAKLMRDQDIGFVPIAGPDGRLMGACTDRDIVVRALAANKPYETPVSDIMTRDLVTVRPDDDLSAAEKLLADAQVTRVPVCDENMHCIGVISLADLARARKAKAVGRVVENVKEPTDNDRHAH